MQWKIKAKIDQTIDGVDMHPIIEQLLVQRGIVDADAVHRFLTPSYEADLHDPFLFRDMERVVTRITDAIRNKECIGIFGDHDADGVSSAAVLAEGLESLGAQVEVYIPDKITEGHGINTDAIDIFAAKDVTVMISVDCGTSSYDAVRYANKKNMDVIITDHHHAPDILPEAYAIINPQIHTETYPFKDLSGTAVAFKVVQALYMRCAPDQIDQLKWYLDIVCVGTVADCVPLVGENRTFVTYGLMVLRKTRRVGYRQICAVGKFCKNEDIRAETVAYYIAPRINAAGRMRHAQYAYDLLRESRQQHAQEKAQVIEELNEERKRITDQITRRVEKIVDKEHQNSSFIIVADADYPVGIIGIVAGRIAEKYKKPTGIFTQYETESRGSFRSVEGVHIVDVLTACSVHIAKFGGHEKAAGATILHEEFENFVQKVNAYTAELLPAVPQPYITVDMEILLSDVDLQLAQNIAALEPFGEGNPQPVFVIRDAIVSDARPVGSTGTHMKVSLTDRSGALRVGAIGFSMSEKFRTVSNGDRIDLVAYVQENVWNGRSNVQLQLIDIAKK